MKIYTKTGDKGDTSLVTGERVRKSKPRVEAYGTLDELNSFLGLLRVKLRDSTLHTELDPLLNQIQSQLFVMGSFAASTDPSVLKMDIQPGFALILEKEMDRMDAHLPRLKNFILPGGGEPASLAHICRTVARRAERWLVIVSDEDKLDPTLIEQINRLSDYFFVLARYISFRTGEAETLWAP